MTAQELRNRYLAFFESKSHTIIPSASLIPRETDASTLFTTAGMHPLVPYLLGEAHPGGKRVVNVQKCVRTGDIDEVGDNRHLTFFEMMGNWSFGDYFKKEAIVWSFEFLTDKEIGLGLDPKRLYVTVFKGENGIPRDEESIETWKKVFHDAKIYAGVAGDDEIIKEEVRIIPLGTDDNFWIAGATGPCGGDTEMFYDTRPEEGKLEGKFSNLVDSFRLIEIWNDVFMEFNKQLKKGKELEAEKFILEGKKIPEDFYEYLQLEKKNVDTGMGVERTLAVLEGKENVFETELFRPLIERIEQISGERYHDYQKEFRIVADHVKASVFMIADGTAPLNVGRGYVLRRLIRRAVRYGKMLGIENDFMVSMAEIVIKLHGDFYRELETNKETIFEELKKEEEKFRKTLENGLKKLEKYLSNPEGNAWFRVENGEQEKADVFFHDDIANLLFDLYQTNGFPIELASEVVFEEFKKKGINLDDSRQKIIDKYNDLFEKHQELSKTASAGMFKGGLQDSGEGTANLHTATHLLLAALRQVLGNHVFQKGSNITPERLRLDFSHGEKMTPEQIAEVENLVNVAIEADLEVTKEEMSLEEAKKSNAMGVFEAKYGEQVTVFSIVKDFEIVSREICGGPHAKRTGALGRFRIKKEEASSAGVRRIKAILE